MVNPNCYKDDMKYMINHPYIYIARAETFGGAKKWVSQKPMWLLNPFQISTWVYNGWLQIGAPMTRLSRVYGDYKNFKSIVKGVCKPFNPHVNHH
jgi:hypothetical protein